MSQHIRVQHGSILAVDLETTSKLAAQVQDDTALLRQCLEELEHWVVWAEDQPINDSTTELIAKLRERLK